VRRVERLHGSFRRVFRLPDNADKDSISATLHDGVLSIHIKKMPSASLKKIEITCEESKSPSQAWKPFQTK